MTISSQVMLLLLELLQVQSSFKVLVQEVNFMQLGFGRSNLSESNPDMYGEGDTLILGADSDQPTLVIRDTEKVGIGTASPVKS